MVRTMRERKFRLLSLYGHLRLCHVLVHRLSRLKRISEKKLVSLLMFLSVIAYLINCLEVETSSYLMPYRRLRNWSDMHIVSGTIHFLLQLMTAMCFVDMFNWSLMKDDWLCLSCRLTKLPSLFIQLIWTMLRCSFGRNKPNERKEKKVILGEPRLKNVDDTILAREVALEKTPDW